MPIVICIIQLRNRLDNTPNAVQLPWDTGELQFFLSDSEFVKDSVHRCLHNITWIEWTNELNNVCEESVIR